MLSTEQQTVFKWLKDILQLPVYANVYKGALELLDNKPSGYITFVSHAGRDLINCLAATTIGADRSRDEYKNNLDKLKKRWQKEWGAEGTEEGHLIPSVTCKLVQKLIDDDEAGHLRASELVDLFFNTFLDYADREKISPNLYQKSEKARKWFKEHAHVREPNFCDDTPSEVESHFRTLDELLYVAACSQFGRIRTLDGILKSQKKPKYLIIVDRALELVKNRFDHQYFFTRMKNPHWIQPLAERGCFQSPPRVKIFDDGSVQFPTWPELRYLKNVATDSPDQVIKIVLALPCVDNPRIYNEILEMALRLRGNQSAKLVPKILEYVDLEHHLFMHRFADLLAYWTTDNQIAAALKLVKALIKFVPDPRDEAKRKRRRETPEDSAAIATLVVETQLDPSPRIDDTEYLAILSEGVRPLAEKEPFNVACILIDAIAGMIHLRTHQEDRDKDIDYSEFWCERLTQSEGDYEDAEKSLVHTLTIACDEVYRKLPDLVLVLDKTLQKQQWRVFKRLRYHLFALHLTEATKPKIQDLILKHEGYDWLQHGYEFQRMVHRACEHFGNTLIAKEECIRIFDSILGGPSEANHRVWVEGFLGEELTMERLKKHRRHFHSMQLRPFKCLLFGKYAAYFRELEQEAESPILDDNYGPSRIQTSFGPNDHSPITPEELANYDDEKLLDCINHWHKEEVFYDGKRYMRVNIQGLSQAFETVFKKSIIPNSNKLRFWMENLEKIERPIFLERMLAGMQDCIEAKNFDNLNDWLVFCNRVLLHTDYKLANDRKQADESSEVPEWNNPRWTVGDFIRVCLDKDTDMPVSAREQFGNLLDTLCTQFDWYLDRETTSDKPQTNLADKGINNPRGKALKDLINFGFWLRRHGLESESREATKILEKRFATDSPSPLTLPEYAILGISYTRILSLDKKWTIKNKSSFFPQDAPSQWLAAFGSYVEYNRVTEPIFEILRDEYSFALQLLDELNTQHSQEDKPTGIFDKDRRESSPEEKLIRVIGRHLFFYYLWGMYPLKGKTSLLERYYHVTDGNRERWGHLFEYVGRTLRDTSEQLEQNLKDRIINFFDWRVQIEEPLELRQFDFWLKAKCLDARWRLNAYSKILDVGEVNETTVTLQIDALRKMLPECTAKVVSCFAKLTDKIRDDTIDIYTEGAKTILRVGIESSDEYVHKNAVLARENLLRAGRYDLMELDD